MNPGKLVVGAAAILALCLASPVQAQINGFGGTGTNWSLNADPMSQSGASITNNLLDLSTNAIADDATSAFYDIPQYIGSFTASFVWQDTGSNALDGFTFALQEEGTNAVGAVGSNYFGYYGMSAATGVAFNFSTNTNPTNGPVSGLGYAPTSISNGPFIPTGAVNFLGGNPIAVNLTYTNNVLTVKVTDTVTRAAFTTNFNDNLSTPLGGTEAYVGFTGGGTAALSVSITNFVFTPGPPPAGVSSKVVLTNGPSQDVTMLDGNESDGVIAINPLNPNQLFVAGNTNVSATPGLFGRYSTNAGTNWANSTLANLPPGAYPAVAWDGYGNLFLAYPDNTSYGTDLALSTNGGQTFALMTNLATGDFADQQRIAVGNGAGLGSLWVLYQDLSQLNNPLVAQGVQVNGFGLANFGSFGPPENVPGAVNSSGYGDIAVGPNGQVMVAFQTNSQSSGLANIYVSVNSAGLAGDSFGRPVLAATNGIGGNTHIPAQPNGLGVNSSAGLAWDSYPTSEHFGRAYLVYTGLGNASPNNLNIYLSYSVTNGTTWSAANRVNDDVSLNSQFLPRMALDPTDGALALNWYDCRNSRSDNAAQIYATVSVDGGLSFAKNLQVGPALCNSSLADSPTDFGDDTGVAFYGGAFYPVWADNSTNFPANPQIPPNTLDVIVGSVIIAGVADLSVTVVPTNMVNPLAVGSNVTYLVTVSNAGPAIVNNNIVLTNIVSPDLTRITAIASTNNYVLTGNTLTWSVGGLAPQSAATILISGLVIRLGNITNLASVGAVGVLDLFTNNNFSTVVIPDDSPDLALTMTQSLPIIGISSPSVLFTMTVTNQQPITANGVTLSDTLPTNLSEVAVTLPPGAALTTNGGIFTFQLGSLANGQTTTVSLTATGLSAGKATNIAVVSDSYFDPTPADNSATNVVQVSTNYVPPTFAVGITQTPAFIGTSQDVVYRFSVTNLGPGAGSSTNVFLTNFLSTNLGFVSASPPPLSSSSNPFLQVFNLGILPVHHSTIVTLTAVGAAVGSATNIVVVADALGEGGVTNQVVTPVLPPVFALGITSSPAQIGGDQEVVYTLNVTNIGPVVVTDALLSNDLSTNLYFLAASLAQEPGGTNPNIQVFDLGPMALGQTASLTITAAGLDAGLASDLAVVFDSLGDGSLTNLAVTPIVPPLLATNMTGNPSLIAIGQTVTNTLSITNVGAIPAYALTISDSLTPNLQLQGPVTFSGAAGEFSTNDNGFVYEIRQLNPGQFVSITMTAIGRSNGLGTNAAYFFANFTTPSIAQVVTPVDAPNMFISMTGSPPILPVGQPLTYNLTVQNLGPVPAYGVVVTDIVPAIVTLTGVTSSQGTHGSLPNGVFFNIGNMAINQSNTLQITATAITPGAAVNSAYVAANSGPNPVPQDSFVSVTNTITNAPVPYNLTVVPGVTSAFISWNTPYAATGQVDYGLTPACGTASFLNTNLATNHVVMLTGLQPDTNYYFQALSVTGALLSSSNGSFATVSTLIMGTEDASYSGFWTEDTAATLIYPTNSQSSDYYYSAGVVGGPTASATYVPTIPAVGNYDVYVWYPGKIGVSTNTPVIITGTTNLVFANVNQSLHSGSWQLVAPSVYYTNGTSGSVVIYNNSGNPSTSVLANAVRWSYNLSQDTPTNGSVPAWWADFYFGRNVSGSADENGDGYSNYADYVLGADPTSASSVLQFSVAPGPTNNTVAFSPWQGGRLYQLLSSTNLARGWQTLTNTPAITTNGAGVFTIAEPGAGAVFYRLSVSVTGP